MDIHWKRTLRTTSSERFLAVSSGKEVAAADLHYLPGGQVAGTMMLLEDAAPAGGWKEHNIMDVLRSLDDGYLPDVDIDAGNLTYTVVIAKVLGNFQGASDVTRS